MKVKTQKTNFYLLALGFKFLCSLSRFDGSFWSLLKKETLKTGVLSRFFVSRKVKALQKPRKMMKM